MLKFLKPSWKKIIFTLILFGLAAAAIYLILGSVFDCMMSWGCNGVSARAFFGYSLGIVLVLPAYCFYAAINFISADADWVRKTYVAFSIIGFFELIYLYLLSCCLLLGWEKHKVNKKREEIFQDNLRAEILKDSEKE